jgi:tetratricopeptide (TPR) repeat protein
MRMDCPDDNTLAALFDGSLPLSDASLIDAHTDECEACRRVLAVAARAAMRAPEPLGHPVSGFVPTAGGPLGPSAAPKVVVPTKGTVIGRYVVLSPLGVGGMGVVVVAYDPQLDRKIALKLLRPEGEGAGDGDADAERGARLLREAQAIARVSAPNVIHVYDAGSLGDRVFVAMELVDGGTLTQWLCVRRRPWSEVLPVFIAAARGLQAAHAAGLVHRDFKPDNVLIGTSGEVKVADFGLARAALAAPRSEPDASERDAHSASVTRTGTLMGTPAYMAPEQKRGEKADARSDQYSFCVALYEALFERRPEPVELSRRAEAEAQASGHDGSVPAWLVRAVVRGLSVLPEDRHPSMSVLLEALDRRPERRSRRRIALALGVCVALASAVGLARQRSEGRALVCTGAADLLAGMWDAPRKHAIEASFAQTDLPYAAYAAGRVQEVLDAYARDWVKVRTEACEATRVRAEQSESVLDQRMQCMDRRLLEFRALSGLFASADGKVVERSVQAAEDLTPVSGCSALRVSAQKSAANPTFNEELAEALTLRLSGRFDDAKAHGQAALDVARATRRGDLEGEALRELGALALEQYDGPAAQPLLFAALTAAERVGADVTVVKSAVDLADALGIEQDKHDEGDRWIAFAATALERLGGDDRLAVDVANKKAWLLYREAHYPEALAAFRDAVRLADQATPNDGLRLASCLNGLGSALLDTQDSDDEAVSVFERSMHIAEREQGPDSPRLTVVLGNLGLAAMYSKRYAEARGYFERAIAIAEPLRPTFPRLPWFLGYLGELLATTQRYDKAREVLLRAISLSDPGGVAMAASRRSWLFGLLCEVERHEKHYDEAANYLSRGLEQGDIPEVDYYGGLLEFDRGRPQQSVALLERACAQSADTPVTLNACNLALARGLWSSPGSRTRAQSLVTKAREYYRDHPAKVESEDLEVDAWFLKHAPQLGPGISAGKE